MTDFSLKQFLANGGQFPHGSRSRSNSGGVRDVMRKQQQQLPPAHLAVNGGSKSKMSEPTEQQGRRMSLGSLSASRLSIASSIGSYTDNTIHKMEDSGELCYQGDDSGRGRLLLSFHYNREAQTLTVKIIQAKELRSVSGGDICAYATISFLPTMSKNRMETKVRMLTSNPVWKEVFRIRNFQEDNFKEHKALVIEVWDKMANGGSQLIGEAVILLRSLTVEELEKGIVVWKYLSLDRQESELSHGQLTFSVHQSHRKKRLTVKIEKVSNAAIPVSATTPCLYVKLTLLQGNNVVQTERTKSVSDSYNPAFNHKAHLRVQSDSLVGAGVKLMLKQEPTARTNHLRRGSVSSIQHYFQNTVGVIHLGNDAEREDLREAWHRIQSCKEKKLRFTLKFAAPRQASITIN